MFYLILAIFWALVAAAFFYVPWLQDFTLRGSGVRAGWVPVGFAIYSFLRWLLGYVGQRRRQAMLDQTASRRPRREAEYRPELDFTKPEPGEGKE